MHRCVVKRGTQNVSGLCPGARQGNHQSFSADCSRAGGVWQAFIADFGTLQVVVAQTAESVGFEGVQQSASDTLADLLLQYISEIGGATHSYAELAGRVEYNVNDLVLHALELLLTP